MDVLPVLAFIPALLLFSSAGSLLVYRVPLRVTVLYVKNGEGQEIAIRVRWFVIGAIVTKPGDEWLTRFTIGDHIIHTRRKKDESVDRKPPESGRSDPHSPEDLAHLTKYLAVLAKDAGSILYHESRFEHASGKVRIGLESPFTTGILYGGFWATQFILQASRIRLEMEPVFDRQCLEMDLSAQFRIDHPLRFLKVLVLAKKIPHAGTTSRAPDLAA